MQAQTHVPPKPMQCWKTENGKLTVLKFLLPMLLQNYLKGSTVQAVTGEKDGKKEFSAIIVEQNTSRISAKTMHDKMMWRASNTAELYL
jgi:hypothetical protein